MAYGAASGNARGEDRLHQERFFDRYLSAHRMFANLHCRLREHRSFNEKMRSFGPPRKLRDAVEEDVLQYFRNNPHASTRATAHDLRIRNDVDVWHVLKDNNLHSYHFQKVQDLLPTDYLPREQFARCCQRQEQEDQIVLKYVLFTDEACFTSAGTLNPHYFHDWQQDNPYVTYRFNYQYRFCVNVWAGIVGNFHISPYLMPSLQSGRIHETFPRVGSIA